MEVTLNTRQDIPLRVAQPGEPDIAVLLVGRGSLYTRQLAEDLSNLARRLRSAYPEWLVEIALLEQGGPSLPQALDSCQRAGAGTIVVLPVFLPLEAATRNWLRFLARRWLERLAAPARVVLAAPFDNPGNLVDAAAESVSLALQSGAAVAAANGQAGTPDPDWSVIPPHAYHVLFCQGPRCTAAGAAEVGAYLRTAPEGRGTGPWPRTRPGCPDRLPVPLQPGPGDGGLPRGHLVLRVGRGCRLPDRGPSLPERRDRISQRISPLFGPPVTSESPNPTSRIAGR